MGQSTYQLVHDFFHQQYVGDRLAVQSEGIGNELSWFIIKAEILLNPFAIVTSVADCLHHILPRNLT